ncbi:hypothetical protein V5O48_015562 [Marasmius crinis-equi]|uniref:RING-type domain-containing protein n=1 Tax=Marasmius crinis-equi TaxID=585013 RepID=A0ABR3EU67_9AGAR
MSTRRRRDHSQQLSLSALYPDRYDVSDVEDDNLRQQEYTKYGLNLGAETPRTPGLSNLTTSNALDESYLANQLSPTPPNEPRGRLWRSASFNEKHRRRNALKEGKGRSIDKDCGICFEYAVNPARTLCCGKLYCTEHITDWLQGPSSDGKCPSCGATSTGILTLPSSSSSATKTYTPPPSVVTSRPRSRNEAAGHVVPTITIQTASPVSDDSSSEDDSVSTSSESQSGSPWEELALHHDSNTALSNYSIKKNHAPPIPLDSETVGQVAGNFLCLVGLTLAVYVLVS